MEDTPQARICCLDLDTFFVSVERLLDPTLVGKPVVVGGRKGSRGVVTSASYEVRPLGVRSGMSMRDAVKLAPDAIYVPTRHGVYSPYAKKVKEILERYSPEVRTASIDEFFIDFSGCERMFRLPTDVDDDATIERAIRRMRQDIQDELGLPASAGVGATRSIAKMASGFAKPAGVYMVRCGGELAFVRDLPVRKFPGIGPVAEEALHTASIYTLGQLLDADGEAGTRFRGLQRSLRRRVFPTHATRLGRDRPAFREHDVEGLTVGSISNERTFFTTIGNLEDVEAQVRGLCDRTCWRARKRGVNARTITLKLRWSNFETITRGRTIGATHFAPRVWATARELLHANWQPHRQIRLVGVQLSNLVPDLQLEVPFEDVSRPPHNVAIDTIRDRFGFDAILLGPASQPVGVTDKTRWSGRSLGRSTSWLPRPFKCVRWSGWLVRA